MALLDWHNIYSIGNDKLDTHHKKLFSILNTLYDMSFKSNNEFSYDSIIDELVSYADYHFKAEEQYMINRKYMDIDSHIMQHKYFTERTMQLKQKNIAGDSVPTSELIVFLGNWLLKHVIEEDKRIALQC
jgi:hemerythrin